MNGELIVWNVDLDKPDYLYFDCSDSDAPKHRTFEAWRRTREVLRLRYLWKKQELIARRIHWITRRTDPRWKSGRWKAKT